mmetsp:Transcript_21573/g.66268  ORF Transcript_21573/g.66268 Transcript_21573/m.66268 type:complete len:279 (-) Transcript_21573:1319-2155(-)
MASHASLKGSVRTQDAAGFHVPRLSRGASSRISALQPPTSVVASSSPGHAHASGVKRAVAEYVTSLRAVGVRQPSPLASTTFRTAPAPSGPDASCTGASPWPTGRTTCSNSRSSTMSSDAATPSGRSASARFGSPNAHALAASNVARSPTTRLAAAQERHFGTASAPTRTSARSRSENGSRAVATRARSATATTSPQRAGVAGPSVARRFVVRFFKPGAMTLKSLGASRLSLGGRGQSCCCSLFNVFIGHSGSSSMSLSALSNSALSRSPSAFASATS